MTLEKLIIKAIEKALEEHNKQPESIIFELFEACEEQSKVLRMAGEVQVPYENLSDLIGNEMEVVITSCFRFVVDEETRVYAASRAILMLAMLAKHKLGTRMDW